MTESEKLEELKKNYLTLINFKNIIEKLESNADFQALVREYCIEECARLVAASGDENVPESKRNLMLEMAKGCGHFSKFLAIRKQMGALAESELAELDEDIQNADKEEE